jgi:hypothetical protein
VYVYIYIKKSVFDFSLYISTLLCHFMVDKIGKDKTVSFGERAPGRLLILLLQACGLSQANLFPHYFLHQKSTGIMTTVGS